MAPDAVRGAGDRRSLRHPRRCPENRAEPQGRTIGLRVVVLPALFEPVRADAVTWLAGGPAALVDEQDVAIGVQLTRLPALGECLLGGRVSRARCGRSPYPARCPCSRSRAAVDPQDPVTNLSDLKRHFPDSRTVVFPHTGHQFHVGGCADPILTDFVERGTTRGLDTTSCAGAVVVPPFELAD